MAVNMNATTLDSSAAEPLRDPIVEEVRAIRARLLKEAGGTLEGLFATLQASEAKRGAPLVTLPPRAPDPITDAA